MDNLEVRINTVDRKIDDLSIAVADALDVSNEANQKQLVNHERRIMRLERKPA